MIEKKYLKTKPVCKVKFALPADAVAGAKKVSLVGEFNDWDPSANPMRKQKSGVYASTLDLDVNKEYQFRYVLDDEVWLNDEAADHYAPSQVSHEQNGVVAV